MYTTSAKLTFHIPHATSLKDKRRVCRSLMDRARRRFNAAVAEVDTQDAHRVLTLGVAVVSGDAAHTRELLEEIIRFMEGDAEAELVDVEEC